MAEKTFDISFRGYWRLINIDGIPSESGVYCVYTCLYNEEEKSVSLKKLVYIGESEDVNTRLSNHEKLKLWKKHLKGSETLCFSFGPVDGNYRERCEAAIINYHTPPENTEYAENFPYDKTILNLSGKIKYLNERIVVDRND